MKWRKEVRYLSNTRSTVYNNICSPEKLAQVNPENIRLGNDFLEYLTSIDRSINFLLIYLKEILLSFKIIA